MNAPVITTERLILRGHRLSDFGPLAALWGDARVTRHIGGKPSTREESWARLMRYVGHWQMLGFGFWAVELRHDSRYVGDVGFADNRLIIEPPLDEIPEGGWVFSPAVHGRGIAAEALQAAQAWIDRHHASAVTTCVINRENTASIRLAEKAGYREHARSEFRNVQVIQLRRQRPARGPDGAS